MVKSSNLQAFEAWQRWLISPGIEGGLSNNPYDRGGLTNMGVTIATYLQYAKEFELEDSREGLINLTTDQQKLFAWKYWTQGKCDKMPAKVAVMHADFGWGSGTITAAKHLQRVIGVVADGSIGPITLTKVNSIIPSILLDSLYKERTEFLNAIAKGDQARFRLGWMRRNDSCYNLAKSL